MRYIVLQTQLENEGKVGVQGLASFSQRASGFTFDWIDLGKAKTNYLNPEQCDLLSFEDKDELLQNFEIWKFDETVSAIGVDTE